MSSEHSVYIEFPSALSPEIRKKIQTVFDVPEKNVLDVWNAFYPIGTESVVEKEINFYLKKALKNGWKLQSSYTNPVNLLFFTPFIQPR